MTEEKTSTSNPADALMNNVLSLGDEPSKNEPKSPIVENSEAQQSGPRDEIVKEQVIEAMRGVYDPEIPVNIYELGLIYDLVVHEGEVWIKMTLTSPACPVAGTLPGEVESAVAAVPGVKKAEVELVWEPPYTMEMMSEAARLQLGLMW